MKNLGKIFFTCIILALSLSADVKVSVDATDVTIGERVTLSVAVSGDDVTPPQLNTVCGENIVSTSTRTSVQTINGTYSKKQIFEYIFIPTQSCTIEPISLKVDGHDEVSEPINITVSAMQITKDSIFILELQSDKKSVRVGEPFKLKVVFKQKRGNAAVDSKFAMPEMKNFWIKEESAGGKFEEGDYVVQHLSYIVAAQKSGYHSISPARIEIATRSHKKDSWGQWFAALQWRSYFSNALELEVLPLPEDVTLVGDFAIEAHADTTEVNASQAVNITVKISGSGNFEDIKGFKPKLQGVGIFDEEPVTKASIENGQYKGLWSQKLVFVPNEDITVAPFELRYFDLKTEQVKIIKSEAIKIHVKNAPKVSKEPLKIQRAQSTEVVETVTAEPSQSEGSFFTGLIMGLLSGLFLVLLPWKRWLKRDESEKKSYKNERDVLTLLLNHLEDEEARDMASRLEAKLYEGKTVVIDKKRLKELFKRYSAQ
jgi:hypothetical protein